MIYLATGADVAAARHALGVSQSVLGEYWGLAKKNPRVVISEWEQCGADYVPQPRLVAILLASLRRGWFPAGGQGIKKKRRTPAAICSGQAIRDARELHELHMEQLAAYWGMSRANVGHLELRPELPNPQMWDILLDDLLRQTRASILRWSDRRPPAIVPRKPRGRYALKVGAGSAAQALQTEQALAAEGLQPAA